MNFSTGGAGAELGLAAAAATGDSAQEITIPNSESRKNKKFRIRIYRFDATGLLPLDNAAQPFEGAPCGWVRVKGKGKGPPVENGSEPQ